jgi:Ni,Fe-hydrogenase III large subunit
MSPPSIPKRLKLPAIDADLGETEIFLTPAEVAERWRIHEVTLRNWRAARKGPPYTKLADNTVIYSLSAILTFERDRTITVHKKTRGLASG